MSLTIAQALAISRLDAVDARALLRHALGVDDAYLIANSSLALTDDQRMSFSALAARRAAGEPVAYITGLREFFSLEFRVTPAVLIPRPETELLVEVALEHITPDETCEVLDLGTGSGCIAVTIARERPRACVTAVDASTEALMVARDNAQQLLHSRSMASSPPRGEGTRDTAFAKRSGAGASARARFPQAAGVASNESARRDEGDAIPRRDSFTPTLTRPPQVGGNVTGCLPQQEEDDLNLRFVRSDWFSALGGSRFDLIFSNPPYIAAEDPHLVRGDLRYEPPSALAAGADGLNCIRLIVATAPQYLVRGGWLAFEHGHDQAASCRDLLAQAGFARIYSRRDLSDIERVSGGCWDRE